MNSSLFRICRCAIGLGAFGLASVGVAAASIAMTGRYEWRTDDISRDLHGLEVCFVPDAASARRLPRPAADQRLAWFCFADGALARRLLRLPAQAPGCGLSGAARVVVHSYRVYTGEGDDHDTAGLQSARLLGPAAPLDCGR